MIEPVLLGAENDLSIGREFQRFPGKWRQRIFEFLTAVPQLTRFSVLDVGQQDGPGPCAQWNQWQAVLRARSAKKDQLFTVGRPPRREVAIHTGREIAHLLGRGVRPKVEDGNEAVVFAAGNKGHTASIGRPLGL